MSKIEWTDITLNVSTGCSKVSPGCDNCYMFSLYPRLKAMEAPGYEKAPDVVQTHPARLDLPYRWQKPRMVFVNSMSDTFHPNIDPDITERLFEVMRDTSQHTYQVLTKRPGRALSWWKKRGAERFDGWPPNVWLGVSVESQDWAWRIGTLLKIPAAIRFVSAEPLLGPLDIAEYLTGTPAGFTYEDSAGIERYDLTGRCVSGIDWCITGGESGPKARPMDLDWARSLRDQCEDSEAAFFLKQLGGAGNKRGGANAVLDGRTWTDMPA